jgi:hypothetical protein
MMKPNLATWIVVLAGAGVVVGLGGATAQDGTSQAGEKDALTLIGGGASVYCIVTAPDAPEPERFAADELGRYLSQMSGVQLRIVTRDAPDAQGEKTVLLGEAVPAAARGALAGQGEDAFLIRTEGRRLMLAGASPRATLYAVYALLEDLGVGFPRPGQSHIEQQVEEPGPQEETIPKLSTVRIPPMNRIEKPAFSYRGLVHFPMVRDRTLREIDWMAKNRFNWAHLITNTEFKAEWDRNEVRKVLLPALRKRGIHVQGIGHSFFAYIPPEKYAAEHPEYFAMGPDGKRQVQAGRGGLCVSNPDVVKLMAANMDQFLRENPEIEIIDLWTNDSAAWCLCPECKKMQGVPPEFKGPYATTTRSYLRFVNQVAELLARKHPKIQVNALAYALNMLPDPETTPASNVIVGIAPWGRITYMGSDDYYVPLKEPSRVNSTLHPAILGWLRLSKNVYLYDYYGNRVEFFPIVDTLRKDYAYYGTVGLRQISAEIFYWPEFNMWAFGRLAWDPGIPLRRLVSDFCRIAYRPAAEPMVRFYMTLERWKWEWPRHRAELESLLAQAETKAAGDPTVVAKLQRLRKVLATEPTKTWDHPKPPPPLSD